MTWVPAVVVSVHRESANVRTLALDVPDWPGHVAGQHVDVRLTAEDGYTAVRAYSIASSAVSNKLAITVDKLDDGEVSPYLVEGAEPGDHFEVRGPAGGWFVWRPDSDRPVQLIGGGSGIVPLMAMIRSHGDSSSAAPFRLLYSVRSPETALFLDDLVKRERDDGALAVTLAYSRATPAGWPNSPARLDRAAVEASVFPPSDGATVYVCGSTPFVESVADWLVDSGHRPENIRTERFGGVGGA